MKEAKVIAQALLQLRSNGKVLISWQPLYDRLPTEMTKAARIWFGDWAYDGLDQQIDDALADAKQILLSELENYKANEKGA